MSSQEIIKIYQEEMSLLRLFDYGLGACAFSLIIIVMSIIDGGVLLTIVGCLVLITHVTHLYQRTINFVR
jgi:hypothetical protein